jgi:hypothetical protein
MTVRKRYLLPQGGGEVLDEFGLLLIANIEVALNELLEIQTGRIKQDCPCKCAGDRDEKRNVM